MTQPETAPAAREQRVIRVFVSSTFRDMQDEREELVKRVFPQLRKMCEDRLVTWGEVDLRWGITDEQTAEGKVLPICLAEIERCRPYFIGLLGERYGSRPEAIPDELIAEQPWLVEHREHSVTALEIMHGVLNNPKMAGRSFFYFRDSRYLERLPPGANPADFRAESETARARADALKDRIRGDIPRERVHEDYPDPQALGQLVLEDLTKIIKRLYPIDDRPDPLDQEAAEHEAFAQSRSRVYIGRQEYFDWLDQHAAGDGQPLVVLGESGSGKSALLANWAMRYREQHPDDLVLMHFIGASPYSADWAAMVRRLLGEFQRKLGIEREMPAVPDELKSALDDWLPYVAASGRVVLILDGLNQLEDRDRAQELVWLPRVIPPNVRVILSTLPGKTLEELGRRGWPTTTVELLKRDERLELIKRYLDQYTKALSAEHELRIAEAEQTSNPMYLRVLLDELRLFGEHKLLEHQIDRYLSAEDCVELYDAVLERWEEDYQRDRPRLVRDAMTCIWAARLGLSEAELLDLLGTDEGPLPRAHWSPLHLAAEHALAQRSGRLAFFHDFLRQAVEHRWLDEERAQHAAHHRLADYFDSEERWERRLEELPWQLQEATEWSKLLACVTDISTFKALYERDEYELLAFCLRLPEEYDWGAAYAQVVEEWARANEDERSQAVVVHNLARFLYAGGQYNTAEPLYRRALAIREQALGPEHPDTATSLNDLAELLRSKGNYEGAEPLYRRALAIREQSPGAEHRDRAETLNNLALLLDAKGDYEGAEPLCQRALAIWEQALGPDHPLTATGLNNLALLLDAKGDYEGAEPLYRRALTIDEQALGPEHPDTAISVNNLAGLLNAKGNSEEAEALYRRALAIWEQVLGPDHPHTATGLNNLAELLRAKGGHEEAEPLHRRALAIRERALGREHPDTAISVNNLALVLNAKGNSEEAEPLYRRALAIKEQALGPYHPATATSLNNLAEVLRAKGDYEGAEPLLRRALAIREGALGPDHPDTAMSMSNLAGLLYAKGGYEQAEPLYRRALAILEQVLGPDHPDTATSLSNLAWLLAATGRALEAEPYASRAVSVRERALGPEHPQTRASVVVLERIRSAS